ncbi:TetR/AcrR family transcriptional regulator [Antrihabitans sp. YC2-6]|uniref:TetR/AcrR family transcriptional regulator n=1 Tax=Antrihabitans sp. YC2-6 TaxID=2799498 RepID=UPI0018F7885F|nr:TetR/AcrR family transcriptional regulator [Antrihabitans sp. YC2-6]MBJ8348426.1 TetR/AcrR family transcriptional regulator [Antrihabitans sp. YC2-6]
MSTTETQRLPETKRRRLEPDERRGQILDCAIRMFGERPYAAVSTSDLAKEAGVARGLINHYFGTKRDLYLVVVRKMVKLPDDDRTELPAGSLRGRIEAMITWLLDNIEEHGRTWVVAVGAEGVGDDPEVQRILDEADEVAAERVLQLLGLAGSEQADELRAMTRAYGGLVKAAGREWIARGSLTRDQVHLLLSDAAMTLFSVTAAKVSGPAQ